METISPTTNSGAQVTYTITGQGFGTTANDVTVLIGTQSCVLVTAQDDVITCQLSSLPIGFQSVVVTLAGFGNAKDINTLVVTGESQLTDITPATGSMAGGSKVTLTGNGFVDGSTVVNFDTKTCDILSVTLDTIVCIVPSVLSPGTVNVSVTTGGTVEGPLTYEYDDSIQPTITDVSPAKGTKGHTIEITGEIEFFKYIGTSLHFLLNLSPPTERFSSIQKQ